MQSSSSCLWRPSARTVLILYLSFSACTSWRPDNVTPQAVIQAQPQKMRVTYTDSSTVTTVIVNNPELKGDTIVGRGADKADMRVPLASVLQTETRQSDAVKSVFAVLGIAFVVVAVVLVIECNQTDCLAMGN